METEQEGINLETINLGTEENITLPNVDNENEEVEDTSADFQEESINNDNDNVSVDDEKESLKKGINAERRARKEAEKKAKELEARITALENASKEPEKSTLQGLIESGIDEDVAKSIAEAIDQNSASTKKELADMKFQNALLKKSKESGFSDILDCAEDVKKLVDKGLTIEQAYYAINHNNTNNTNSEIQRKVEAKMQNNKARKEILGNINSNAGGAITNNSNKPKATAEEIAIARLAGMSIEDYLASKNADSLKQYNEYKSKKVK